jgi:hypothetical protein
MRKNQKFKSLFISIDSSLGCMLTRHANMACHIGLGMKLSPNRKFKIRLANFIVEG